MSQRFPRPLRKVLIGLLALLLLLACPPPAHAGAAAPPPGGGLDQPLVSSSTAGREAASAGGAPPAAAVVEHLRLRVPAGQVSAWQEAERLSWEPWLHSRPGFLRRDLFWDAERQEGILLIHWRSRKEWKAIGAAELERVQRRFEDLARAAVERESAVAGGGKPSVGGNPFPLVFSGELMTFPATSPQQPPDPAP